MHSAFYPHLHRGGLPRRFAYMASAHRWAGFGLNYMYVNLKAKGFAHMQGRTCQKPGHSCFRKVISWCSHPAVDYYCWLARGRRGAQTLVAAWGRGHGVSSLKTAADELKSKVAALFGPAVDDGAGAEGQAPGPVHTPSPPSKALGFEGFGSSKLLIIRRGNAHVRRNCLGSLLEGLTQGFLIGKILRSRRMDWAYTARCKAHMPCPAFVVADAAQMYEEVPRSRIRHSLRSLITWATDSGYTGIAVIKRTAGPSFLVRQRWRHPPGTVLFKLPGMSSARAWTWPSPRARSPLGIPFGSRRRDFPSEDPIARPAAVWSWGPTRPLGPTTQRPAPGTASCRGAPLRRTSSAGSVCRRPHPGLQRWCSSRLEDMLAVMYRKPVRSTSKPRLRMASPG